MPQGETTPEEIAASTEQQETTQETETKPEDKPGETVTPGNETEQPEEEAPKFAGKYESEDDFAKGINAARKQLGLDEAETVIGEGGLYADAEAAERGYRDLTKLLRTTKQPEGDQTMRIGEGEETGDTADEAASPEQILSKAELSMADLEAQYAEKGELTDEQYKAIQKVRPGLSREIIDSMADGMIAKASLVRQEQARMRAEAAEIVGGDENLQTMLKSARSFVPADEIEDIQQRLADPKRFKGAVRDLKDFHTKAVGADKAKPLAGGGGPAGSSGAKDSTEFARLMRQAGQGNAEAARKIRNTPQSKIDEWLSAAV